MLCFATMQSFQRPQSAWLFAFLLLTSFFLFDSYYWHLFPFSWNTTSSPPGGFPSEYQQQIISGHGTSNASEASPGSAPPAHQRIRTTRNASDSPSNGSSSTQSLQAANATQNAPLTRVPLPPEMLSLKSLEAGLRNARVALRKAVLEKNVTRALQAQAHETNNASDYSPWGAIYRNASIFRQSYLEMEKRFKVFVYPEGEEPLVHNGPCKEIYSIEGRFIQELQGRSTNPFLTADPAKAHVFFLPFSVSMMVTFLYERQTKDRKPMLHFVRDYVDVVATKYPFWNRSEGADHFMLSCHDWGPFISRARTDLEKHAIRVLCNADSAEGFVADRDASLPEINLVGGRIPAKLGGPSMGKRPHLAFFAGRDHGPVRPQVYKHWEGKDGDVLVYQELPKGLSYHEMMKRSKFCLCPSGYEVNSPRIVEAIYNDCVPVIIADRFVLPFSDVLDWEAFSLRVRERDIPDLKRILLALPEAKVQEMQERVRQVRRHFLLNQPPQRYDVFHMILHSVWLRRLNIRLSYS